MVWYTINMNHPKLKKISQISYIVFNFLLLLTIFLPVVSLDKYVEYDFNYGYYNENYQSYSVPIATKIKPVKIISILFSDISDAALAASEYSTFKADLNEKLANGEITKNEYDKILSSSKITNNHITYSLQFGTDKETERFKGKLFLYAVLLLVLYSLIAINIVLCIVNLSVQKKTIYIANVFISWIYVILYLIFIILTFSQVITSTNNIEGFNGTIMEEITTCMSPKTLSFIILLTLIC